MIRIVSRFPRPAHLHSICILAIVSCSAALFLQGASSAAAKLTTGKQIYYAGCAGCHGVDGKGLTKPVLGFNPPRTYPDFTQCSQTTPEPDSAWKAVIRNGGKFRGFSSIMPSFRDALTAHQIDLVVEYLRGFCTEKGWARGELNLPRAIVTEKAFPENEVVITSAINTRGAPGVSSEIVHEQRFGMKTQIEVGMPVNFLHDNHTWYGGLGDAVLGLKRVIFSDLHKGSIFSVQGEAIFPTGNKEHGIGTGTPTFETFAAFGQLLPANFFYQFQGGFELPTDTSLAPRALYYRSALGKSFYEHHGLGRLWSPIVEFLADRDLISGAKTNWDIAPEMQFLISRRQHIRANIGFRVPVNNTTGRGTQAIMYVLWDFQDGRLTEGW